MDCVRETPTGHKQDCSRVIVGPAQTNDPFKNLLLKNKHFH